VHLICEAVGEGLTLTSWDEGSVTSSGQVAEDAWWVWSSWYAHWSKERTADKEKAHWGWLFIVDGQNALGWVVVDQLHAEHLGLRELRSDLDLQVWGRAWVLDRLIDLVGL